MSDDQNPQHDDTTSSDDHDQDKSTQAASDPSNLPAPPTPAPVYAASSKLPPMSSIPLTPVVGGGAALRPDGGGENVGQKPWFWFLVALTALVIAAIVFTQCTGSDGPATSTVPGQTDTDTAGSSTTVASGSSTTTVVDSTTTTVVIPSTTAPPGLVTSSVPGDGSLSGLTQAQITGLQAQCVYGDDAQACATLTAAGFTADQQYGVPKTLTDADDATLSTWCTSGTDQLACLELAQRKLGQASPDDQADAEDFAAAVVAGDIATVQTLAAPYVVQQTPQLTAGPYAAGPDIPGTQFNNGKFSFKVQASGSVVCWISQGVVVYCLVNPNS